MDPVQITVTATNLISGADSATNLWTKSRRRGGRGKVRANLDAPEVRGAAGAFLECNLKLLTTAEWIAGGVAMRDGLMPELGVDALAKFGVLTALCDSDTLNDAAGAVARAVGEALQRFPHEQDGGKAGPDAIEHFHDGLSRARDACGRLVAVLATGELLADLEAELRL